VLLPLCPYYTGQIVRGDIFRWAEDLAQRLQELQGSCEQASPTFLTKATKMINEAALIYSLSGRFLDAERTLFRHSMVLTSRKGHRNCVDRESGTQTALNLARLAKMRGDPHTALRIATSLDLSLSSFCARELAMRNRPHPSVDGGPADPLVIMEWTYLMTRCGFAKEAITALQGLSSNAGARALASDVLVLSALQRRDLASAYRHANEWIRSSEVPNRHVAMARMSEVLLHRAEHASALDIVIRVCRMLQVDSATPIQMSIERLRLGSALLMMPLSERETSTEWELLAQQLVKSARHLGDIPTLSKSIQLLQCQERDRRLSGLYPIISRHLYASHGYGPVPSSGKGDSSLQCLNRELQRVFARAEGWRLTVREEKQSGSASKESSGPRTFLNQGKDLLRRKRFAAAQVCFEAAMQASQGTPQIYREALLKASANAVMTGNHKKSRALANKALQLESDATQDWSCELALRALNLRVAGNHRAAMRMLLEAYEAALLSGRADVCATQLANIAGTARKLGYPTLAKRSLRAAVSTARLLGMELMSPHRAGKSGDLKKTEQTDCKVTGGEHNGR